MLPFPSMVEWDADELAGNYFSRLAGENGVSSKYAFLRWLGFSRNLCHGQIMDIVNLSPTWIALAEKLEISLDDILNP
ncbi:hypothetical protein VAR608DRAFT_4089 [Variovorax sp. HW608]|uniref:hypothetical protein n=1 Tax=Variovorax sp. HW608 TaxID=1034889 RepID=UPI00081FD559|nr:hypothetical protein [Variovorax sp. HW608]SCK42643.1 hypothetical protein VAR608DRAFT_4089 [Variovorax sp. HW608]